MATRQNRFLGLMQRLLLAAGQNAYPTSSTERGTVVTQQDALTAVLLLAAPIDKVARTGQATGAELEHMAEMLMVLREYVKPLPAAPEGPNGEDLVTQDLQAAVAELRGSTLRT